MKQLAYTGIDYHMNTISVAVIIKGQNNFFDTIHMKNNDKTILKYKHVTRLLAMAIHSSEK